MQNFENSWTKGPTLVAKRPPSWRTKSLRNQCLDRPRAFVISPAGLLSRISRPTMDSCLTCSNTLQEEFCASFSRLALDPSR